MLALVMMVAAAAVEAATSAATTPAMTAVFTFLSSDCVSVRVAPETHQCYLTTNDVRSVPAEPQETTICQRPGVVLVPTFHVHETRPARGVLGYKPCASDGPLL